MKKGTYVLRSTYQKLAEENKRLKEDLRIITSADRDNKGEMHNARLTLLKWRKYFLSLKNFFDGLKEYAQTHPLNTTK